MIRPPAVGAVSLVAGAAIALGLLVAAFRPAEVHGLGWDAAGYVVQIRAASDGVLDLPASRPGVGTAGAFLAGIGVMPPGVAPVGLSLVVAIGLGLGAAVAFRRTWTVAGSAIGSAVVLAATWGGTTRLVSGYLANLVALSLFLLAIVLAVSPRPPWPAVGLAFGASLLAHPGAAPAWAAILVGWAVLEAVARRDRDPDRAISTLVAFLAAAVVVSGLLAWVIGLALEDLQDLGLARERFDERAREIVAWIRPALTLTLVVAGITLAVLLRRGVRSRAAERLGIAWLAVCAAGLPLLAAVPALPAHRLVLLAIPVPLLAAGALAAVAQWFVQREGTRWAPAARIAPVAALVLAVGVAILALAPFHARASRPGSSLGPGPSAVAGYLRATRPDAPVVLVMDPPDIVGLLAWKARLNAVRALAPDRLLLRIVAYVGDERALAVGRPTRRDGLFGDVVDRTWPSVRAALDEDPVVLAVRSWVGPDAWARLARASTVVAEEVAVVRGPLPVGEIAPAPIPSMQPLKAFGRVALVLALLAAIGSGWARLAAFEGGIDAVGLAPIVGLAIVVLAGVAVALAGADPGGPAGVGVVAIGAIAGWLAPLLRRKSYRRSSSASSTRSTSAAVW